MAEKFWMDDTRGFPCKDCQDRHLACWQDCERYKKAKQEHIEKKRKQANEKAKRRDCFETRGKRYLKVISYQGRPESWKEER